MRSRVRMITMIHSRPVEEDTMTDQTLTQIQKQLDSMIALPARTYGSLMLDHMEQLWNLQYEATKAYAEAGLQCTVLPWRSVIQPISRPMWRISSALPARAASAPGAMQTRSGR